MSNERRPAIGVLLRPIVGLSILTVLIFLVGFDNLRASWEGYSWRWLALAAISIAASTLLGGFNLHLILYQRLGMPFARFIRGFWLAWAFGLIVPGQLGDIIGISYWMKSRGLSWQATSSLAVIDKLISLAWMMLFAVTGLYIVSNHIDGDRDVDIGMLATGVVAASVLVLLLGYVFFSRLQRLVKRFTEELVHLRDNARWQMVLNACFTPCKIFLIAGAYWAVFRAAGVYHLDVFSMLCLVAASSIVAYVPVSFNGVGTVEWVGLYVFAVFDIDAATVLSVFISLRLMVIMLAWVPTGILLAFSPKPAGESFS